MNLGTLDLSSLPPVAVWCMVVIILVCHVLPDAISFVPKGSTTPLASSTDGTSSAPSSPTTKSSVA